MPTRYAYFVLLNATPAWLRLSRSQRRALTEQHLAPLLVGPEAVRMRDSPMLTVPYFELKQIVPAIEKGYVAFEQAATQ